jgi:hypothetical protein
MIRYASVVCQRISKIAARNWLVILMSAILGLLIRTPCGKFVGTAPDAWNERLFELPLIYCVGLSGSGGIGNCEVVCVCRGRVGSDGKRLRSRETSRTRY